MRTTGVSLATPTSRGPGAIMTFPIVLSSFFLKLIMVFEKELVLILIGVFLMIQVASMTTFAFLVQLLRYMVSMQFKGRLRSQCHHQELGVMLILKVLGNVSLGRMRLPRVELLAAIPATLVTPAQVTNDPTVRSILNSPTMPMSSIIQFQ